MTGPGRHAPPDAGEERTTRVPVGSADLGSLFIRPARFFRDRDLDVRAWYLPALLCTGLTSASSRIDQNLMRADLGQARPGWDTFAPILLQSWGAYWAFVLVAGLIYAAFYWYLGGWWYRVRLRWSGAHSADRREARLVMAYAALVMSAPTLVYMVMQTVSFPDYGAAWESESLLPILILIFPFWAVYTSYRGVRTRFEVGKWKARVWFLILPSLVFLVLFGVVAVLYAALEPVFGGGGNRFA